MPIGGSVPVFIDTVPGYQKNVEIIEPFSGIFWNYFDLGAELWRECREKSDYRYGSAYIFALAKSTG